MLHQGIFTISIDYEFGWGYPDFDLSEEEKERMRSEVAIVKRLIGLFERYRVPATWAVVGHLLDDNCPWRGEVPHPEYPRPINTNERRDWFLPHPPRGEYDDPLWFDTNGLIAQIQRSHVGHEIGSHSYAHIIYGASDINETAVQADLDHVVRIHKRYNLPLTSFVFPRNGERFHNLVRRAGFQCFRGHEKHWHQYLPGPLARAGHLFEHIALPLVRTVHPYRHNSGLINVPGTMTLLSRNGLRKFIRPMFVSWKARRGLRKAAASGELFHLWFHPSNFSFDTDAQFAVLEHLLQAAAALRDREELSIATMADVQKQVTS